MVTATMRRACALVALLAMAARGAPEGPLPPAGPSLEAMIAVTDISSVAISPNGRWVVYRAETASVARNDYDIAWYVVARDGRSSPRRVTDAGAGNWPDGQIFSYPPLWSADSRYFYYRAAIDGSAQVWRAAAEGGAVEQVSHDAADVTGFVIDPASGAVVYGVGATRAEIAAADAAAYADGVLIDRHVDPNRPLYRGGRIDGRSASERLTGSWFAHGGLLADHALRFMAIDPQSGTARPAGRFERARLQKPATPLDARAGQRLLASTNSDDARGVALVLADGVHGRLAVTRTGRLADAVSCVAAGCRGRTIAHVDWLPGEYRLLVTTSDGAGDHALQLWDPARDTLRSVAAPGGTLDGGRDTTRGCAVDRAAAICVSASANAPPRLLRIDFARGRTVVLADPNAELRKHPGPQFVPLRWTSQTGDRFSGQWLPPVRASGPAPLFLTYYICSGYLRGGTGDEFPLRQLAAAGIGVLCINRASAGPDQTDNALEYRRALAGIEAAVDLLVARGDVDRRRIGMGGLSFGAEITMWTAMRSNLLAASAVATSLLTPTFYWFASMPGRDAPALMQKVWGLGPPDIAPERWQALSPAFNAASIKAPLLMQAPEQEYRANLELAVRLDRVGTPVETWAFPDETHIKHQPVHKLAAGRRYLDWFRFWLQNQSDPDPAKSEQYRRWRAFARQPGWHDRAVPPSQASTQTSVSASARTR